MSCVCVCGEGGINSKYEIDNANFQDFRLISAGLSTNQFQSDKTKIDFGRHNNYELVAFQSVS